VENFWKEVECDSWEYFLSQIQGLSGAPEYEWIFRGHSNSAWLLKPTIERLFDLHNIAEKECDLYEGFHSKAHLYSSRLPLQGDHTSWIAMMQHHGCPTRLLDWTYSPLVATFFSLAEPSPSEYSAVWAIAMHELKSEIWWNTKEMLSDGIDDQGGPRVVLDAIGTRHATELGKPLVRLVTPSFETQRISAQQGCFLYNCDLNRGLEESLAEMMNSNHGWALKFMIPKAQRETFLKRLMWMNIHDLSLFPDLEGLSRFLSAKSKLLY
jgi:hypothetical protein